MTGSGFLPDLPVFCRDGKGLRLIGPVRLVRLVVNDVVAVSV